MSDLVKHTLTINISDRIDWIDKRCGLTEIQKDYIAAQMKEAIADAVLRANAVQTSDSGLHLQRVSNNEVAVCTHDIWEYDRCPYLKGGRDCNKCQWQTDC